MPIRKRFLAVAAILLPQLISPVHANATVVSDACVDLAIVLAVDGSGSVTKEEFRLQQQALVMALRDPAVQQAMESAGSVAAAVMYWGDAERPVQETGFVLINEAKDVEPLVTAIQTMPRKVLGGTGLSMGLAQGLNKLETLPCASRSVINVSGDGSDSIVPRRKRLVPALRDVRARAEAANVTINALVITSEEEDLKSCYEMQVITGPGAFVVEIGRFGDYADALRRKLIREIAPVALSRN